MNTALKLSAQSTSPALDVILNTRRQEQLEEMYQLFGWCDLPQSIKHAIDDDMVNFYDELYGRYTDTTPETKARKKRITYWIHFYQSNPEQKELVVEMLSLNKAVAV